MDESIENILKNIQNKLTLEGKNRVFEKHKEIKIIKENEGGKMKSKYKFCPECSSKMHTIKKISSSNKPYLFQQCTNPNCGWNREIYDIEGDF